jgi:hypothetical protein
MFSEVFWTAFIGSIIACLTGALRLCYKSKCTTVKFCCNLLEIERDTAAEAEIDERTPTSRTEEGKE